MGGRGEGVPEKREAARPARRENRERGAERKGREGKGEIETYPPRRAPTGLRAGSGESARTRAVAWKPRCAAADPRVTRPMGAVRIADGRSILEEAMASRGPFIYLLFFGRVG